MKVIICTFVIIMLTCLKVNAKVPANPVFKKLIFENNFSLSTVTQIYKDSEGFIWFGTINGLVKFNAYSHEIYSIKNPDSIIITNYNVNCIYEDGNKQLWIGTSEGLKIMDRETNSLKIPGSYAGFSANIVYDITENNKGNLLLATNKGVFSLSGNQKSKDNPEKINPIIQLFPGETNCLFADVDNTLWIGSFKGLVKLDLQTNSVDFYDPIKKGSNHIIKAIYKKKGKFWIGTYNGLFLFDPDTEKFTEFSSENKINHISNNTIYSIIEDKYNNLWIGTDKGLNVYDTKNQLFECFLHDEHNPNTISQNSIWSLYADDEGIIWVGTYTGQVNQYLQNRPKFKLYRHNITDKNSISGNLVSAMYEDNRQNIWIGTDGTGLNLFNPDKGTFGKIEDLSIFQSFKYSQSILALNQSGSGSILIGSFKGGLYKLNLQNGNSQRIFSSPDSCSIQANDIWSIYDDDSVLWIGNWGSLEKYEKKNNCFKHFFPDPEDKNKIGGYGIISLFGNNDGTLWIGTYTGGISILDRKTDKITGHFRNNPGNPRSISNNCINKIHTDKNKNIWIGTANGLNLYSKKDTSFFSFYVKNGLPGNCIYGILNDNHNNLWISTDNGISRFSFEITVNKVEGTFKNYFKSDGLQDNRFYRNSCLKTRNGMMLFGGINGLNVFYPDSIKDNYYVPEIALTDFKVFYHSVDFHEKASPLKKHINQTRQITINHKQNVISFYFTALSYSHPQKNHYAFQLEGLDNNWNYVGNQRMATYTNIPPGKYTFKVKGSNQDGIWNNNYRKIELIVKPPPWKTVPAYVIYFLVFSLLLYAFMWSVRVHEKDKSRIKMERLARDKEKELNQGKLQFFTSISHELKTPLTIIAGLMEDIIATCEGTGLFRKKVSLVSRNTQLLLNLVKQLLDFRKADLNKLSVNAHKDEITSFIRDVCHSFDNKAIEKNIRFSVESKSDNILIWFDKDKMELIVYNLLSNAFKVTPENGTITIKMYEESSWFYIQIKDSGKGIPEEEYENIFERFYQIKDSNPGMIQGTGIGLALTRQYVGLHNGTISVNSTLNTGTEFIVKIPAGDKFLSEKPASELVEEVFHDKNKTERLVTGSAINKENETELKEIALTEEEKEVLRNKTLLIVEDNQEMREFLKLKLENEYIIIEAIDGLKGLNKAVKMNPDLIIADLMLPEMDGIRMCKQIKTNQKTSHIPIIILTARTSIESKVEGLETGADAYIEKPFHINHLLAQIRNLLISRHQLKKIFTRTVHVNPDTLPLVSLDKNFLKKALQIVEQNFTNPEFDVKIFSKELGISNTQLYRKLKAITGKSANEFINAFRLNKSAELLHKNELNISEIAHTCGFNDPLYFSKVFKKHFGTPPSKFISR